MGDNLKSPEELDKRNMEIMLLYEQGAGVPELALRYHLSEDRIRSILYSDQTGGGKDG